MARRLVQAWIARRIAVLGRQNETWTMLYALIAWRTVLKGGVEHTVMTALPSRALQEDVAFERTRGTEDVAGDRE
jgi:hypothetical protein